MKNIQFACLKIKQPIGEFFIASISHKDLISITYSDQRKIVNEDSDLDNYLGIQRPLSKKRVIELKEYVKTSDACFPTGIILAVNAKSVIYDDISNLMTLTEYIANIDNDENDEDNIEFASIAKILDGQHRVAGLAEFSENDNFDINVTIFVDIDIAEQAQIFSTVNLAQTKVNKSLVYDLYDLANHKSPQKACHNIAVTLNKVSGSPFYHKIKRLGVATEGRFDETITQATFVRSFIRYISKNEIEEIRDRDIYMKGKTPQRANEDESKKLIFRNMIIDNREMDITDIIWNYYEAISERWELAWNNGNMLNRSNGFKACARYLRDLYNIINKDIPTKNDFLNLLQQVDIEDEEFNTKVYLPGAKGESDLYKDLVNKKCHIRR